MVRLLPPKATNPHPVPVTTPRAFGDGTAITQRSALYELQPSSLEAQSHIDTDMNRAYDVQPVSGHAQADNVQLVRVHIPGTKYPLDGDSLVGGGTR